MVCSNHTVSSYHTVRDYVRTYLEGLHMYRPIDEQAEAIKEGELSLNMLG